MKDPNRLLIIVILIISVLSLVFVFTGSKNIKEAQKVINNVKTELGSVKDSIKISRATLDSVLFKLSYTKTQLKIIETERNLLETEVHKMLAKDWNELQSFKSDLDKLNKQNASLREEAKKWEE